MKSIALFSVAATVAALGLTLGPAGATTLRPSTRAQAESRATSELQSHAAEVRNGPGQAFSVRSTTVDSDGASHVHFDRSYRGLHVLGGDVIVHDSAAGAFRSATATLAAPLSLATTPHASSQSALRIALSRLPGGRAVKPTLVVDALGSPRLAWEVHVSGFRTDRTPSELVVTVDAATGRVLHQWDTVNTGTGNGFFNGAVTLNTTLSGTTHQLKDPTRGNNYTTDMKNGTLGNGTLFTDSDDVWGTGSLSSRQTTAVDAQYGVAETFDYYKNVHGRNGIAGNGAGSYNRVHYSSGYNNAFWSDSCFCMTYGDGDGVSYNPFDSLDVAGHEMTHGVTSRTAGLTYSGESGGINESTSDIFGTAVEFYANNPNDTPDFLIGEKLAKNGVPLRWMDKPSKDGKSADCWSSGVGSLDVHYSSGVGNHWFFLLANGSGTSTYGTSPTCDGGTNIAIARTDAEKIYYRALTVYMTSNTNYAGARTATLSAASDLFGAGSTQYNAVANAWAAVNVGGRVSTGNTVTVNNPGNQTGTVGTAKSVQITATDSATGQTLTYSATGLPPGEAINSSTGLISGTPTTAGTYSVTVTAKDTTNATGSTSFTWTINTAGGGCASPGQKLGNPGFETGSAAPWTATAGVIDNSASEPAHTGSWKAWLDGYGSSHTDTLSQSVAIPAGCSTYTFSFWLHIDTSETTTTVAYDKLTVAAGTTTLATYSNLNKNTGYAQKSFNLSGSAGQTVTLKFTGTEDVSLQTSFVIDDTAVNVS